VASSTSIWWRGHAFVQLYEINEKPLKSEIAPFSKSFRTERSLPTSSMDKATMWCFVGQAERW